MLIKDKKKVPARTIAITFDDGFQDNYRYAFAILKKYNLPATIFIIVNEVAMPNANRLTWNEIIEMKNSGIITFGSHALDAQPLIEIKSDAQLRKQIFLSKEILEERLNSKVTAFSYAHGSFTPEIRQLIIDAGYKFSVATRPRNYPRDDIFALRRIRISEKDKNLLRFWFKACGYHNLFSKRK
jgi:peptidoglycan/xylan/chitin deacetylase (PgdA/CDA1 family)